MKLEHQPLRKPALFLLGLILFFQLVIPSVVSSADSLGIQERADKQLDAPFLLDGTQTQTQTQTASAPPTSSPSPFPSLTPTLPPSPTKTSTPVIRLSTSSRPEVFAFIDAVPGALDRSYVILTAYRSVPSEYPLKITGTINSVEFVCSGSPCLLPVERTSRIQFYAQSQAGETSDKIQATVRSELREDGYYVSIETLSQFFTFSDACAGMWDNTYIQPGLSWAVFPQNPNQLNTKKTLHHLVANLITSGIVNAKDCPGGGGNYGAPNACGLERARESMINWQNQYDFNIWLTSKNLRLPPRLLKTLLEIESQFWPANRHGYLDEFGLGQINQLGIDVLLRQNPSLYQQVCTAILSDCSVPYSLLSPANQAMIRGAILNSLDADCPTCPNGIDQGIARQSLTLVALLLRANCQQTKQILDEYEEVASYEDFWKFTLVSYHGGFACLDAAVKDVSKSGETMDWKHVSRKLDCTAPGYVNRFWESLLAFDQYRLPLNELALPKIAPMFIPTPTSLPTIGPPPSRAEVWVVVILDMNNNGIGEATEWVNGIPIELVLPSGSKLNGTTTDGKAVFSMAGITTGTQVLVNIPSLYRSETIRVPESGVVPVVFVFQSVAPTLLP